MLGIVLFLASLLLLAVMAAIGLAIFAAVTARRVEAALPPLGKFIDVAGARLHYVERGAGRPVVMIHGLGGQVRHFTHSLADRLEGDFHLVLIDRPGSGHSTRARGADARLSTQAESVASAIAALRLDRPLLVGHSLGGGLSLAIALAHPELVGGLALIAPVSQVQELPPPAFERLAIASPLVRRIVAWTLALPMSIRNSRAVLAMVFSPEQPPADFPMKAGGLLGLRPAAFEAMSSEMVAANDDLREMVARYQSLAMPVGILYGRADRVLDPRLHGQRLADAIPHATIELVDGGHMLPITQPDRVAAFIREVAARVR
jgi:pimeloyl-ACP methyl ester carboxylesterase